ncbi:hypothetical protein E2562_024765 [Oryza meyeriana var. granulata]|uniref:Uncharacterized protein n=1 Tax=Oryza meyeriana var. granulata TaxID=110450 RepID=A0A6G1FBI5_9ORYZ|nr:hypothetical protein E2562_024765 [Oryza meyeriana var. granulata]
MLQRRRRRRLAVPAGTVGLWPSHCATSVASPPGARRPEELNCKAPSEEISRHLLRLRPALRRAIPVQPIEPASMNLKVLPPPGELHRRRDLRELVQPFSGARF